MSETAWCAARDVVVDAAIARRKAEIAWQKVAARTGSVAAQAALLDLFVAEDALSAAADALVGERRPV